MSARVFAIAAGASSCTVGDCARSTRNASVSADPSVVSLLRFVKSASTTRWRARSLPEATSVPIGPMPSNRMAMYAAVSTINAPNATPPANKALRQVNSLDPPAGRGQGCTSVVRATVLSLVLALGGEQHDWKANAGEQDDGGRHDPAGQSQADHESIRDSNDDDGVAIAKRTETRAGAAPAERITDDTAVVARPCDWRRHSLELRRQIFGIAVRGSLDLC